jgi:hypothetical protein
MSNWQIVLLEPAKTVMSQIYSFFVNLLLVLIVLLIGWLIAKLIKILVAKVLTTIRIDELSARIELDSLLEKGGITYALSELIAVICYWLIILITFMIAVDAIGLKIAADLLNKIVLYIPNIIAAIFTLILGMFVAVLLGNIVQTATTNAGLSQAKLLSKIVKAVVMVFVILIAMVQLNIGTKIIELTVSIVLGSIGLAVAIAFGLGCKDLAARSLSEFIDKLKKK